MGPFSAVGTLNEFMKPRNMKHFCSNPESVRIWKCQIRRVSEWSETWKCQNFKVWNFFKTGKCQNLNALESFMTGKCHKFKMSNQNVSEPNSVRLLWNWKVSELYQSWRCQKLNVSESESIRIGRCQNFQEPESVRIWSQVELINLEILVLLQSLKSSNVEFG